jgi:hypothetical protein
MAVVVRRKKKLRDWILVEGQIISSREILSLRLMDVPNLSSNYKNALWDESGERFGGRFMRTRIQSVVWRGGDAMGTFSGPQAPGRFGGPPLRASRAVIKTQQTDACQLIWKCNVLMTGIPAWQCWGYIIPRIYDGSDLRTQWPQCGNYITEIFFVLNANISLSSLKSQTERKTNRPTPLVFSNVH